MPFPNDDNQGPDESGPHEFMVGNALPSYQETDVVELQIAKAEDKRRQQVESEMRRDEVMYGSIWTPEQRDLCFKERLQFLEDLDRWQFATVELHRMKLEDQLNQRLVEASRHRELVSTIERGNVVAKVVDFANEHPFLTGFFGASIVNRLRRR